MERGSEMLKRRCYVEILKIVPVLIQPNKPQLCESRIIIDCLEEIFPDAYKLIPSDPADRTVAVGGTHSVVLTREGHNSRSGLIDEEPEIVMVEDSDEARPLGDDLETTNRYNNMLMVSLKNGKEAPAAGADLP
ncbi:hypothetical protein L2E82_06668 [Cichorium intybus]|uniref:Uncharacterized protein n=1 Tax=Cichorium intybus TaxID=13427 RepID=A0ACB9HCX2_CICIN|nr:hypothetical protein L2E82_06668 [Cichorium intybus]